MSGDATHGFDLVIEFAEQAIQDIVSAIFDSDGYLVTKILQPLGILGSNGAFRADVNFDRPTDPQVPGTATDVIELHVDVGEDISNPDAELRMVVGLDVDRSGSSDVVRINFKDRLYVAEAKLGPIPIPGLAALLRNTIKYLPIMPFPVDRTTTSPTTMAAADLRIVDDTSPDDRDAAGFLLTFGGGATGDRNAFTQSFISAGGNGAIAVGFEWLCRVISPAIDSALDLGGAFTDCRLTRTVTIDEKEDVDLTALSLSLDDGFIRMAASVRKSGFCYEATGTVAAKILIEVKDKKLLVRSELEDPNVDIDIPWYCWLAAAVVGAIVGGVLFGVIGAIVGGILVPLIMWIAVDTVEGVVNSAAQRVADAINQASPDLDVPALVLSLIFSDVFIDDVTIGCKVNAAANVPIRSEGVVRVPDGAFLDLDSGRVGDANLPSADLAWKGILFTRFLEAVCGARLARTGTTSFDDLSRARLYGYTYDAPNPVQVEELAQLDPFGMIFGGDLFKESDLVYGVRTNEQRWSAVQVVEVAIDHINIRYRTWEKLLPSVEIIGAWQCEDGLDAVVDPSSIVFELSPALVAASPTTPPVPDPCAPMVASVRSLLPADLVRRQALEAVPLEDRRLGRWSGTVRTRARDTARFDAVTQGFGPGLKARWEINGKGIPAASGDVDVEGVSIHHQTSGARLVLGTGATKPFEILLGVTVTDHDGTSASTSRCVRYEPQCERVVRYVPTWLEYRTAYLENFGVVEVGRGAVSPEVSSVEIT